MFEKLFLTTRMAFLVLIGLFASLQSSFATDFDWNGGTGMWSEPTNWTPNGVPDLEFGFDNATIENGTAEFAASPTNIFYVEFGNTLTIGTGGTWVQTGTDDSPIINGTLQVNTGGTFDPTLAYRPEILRGTVNANGGILLNPANRWTTNSGSESSLLDLDISNGGKMYSPNLLTINDDSSLTIDGGTLVVGTPDDEANGDGFRDFQIRNSSVTVNGDVFARRLWFGNGQSTFLGTQVLDFQGGTMTVTDGNQANAVRDSDFGTPEGGHYVNFTGADGTILFPNITNEADVMTILTDGRVRRNGSINASAFDITAVSGGIQLTLAGTFDPAAGDFDMDGDVDGNDFLVWQRNTSVGSLSDWQSTYGYAPPLVSAVTAVPEPAAGLLMALALLASTKIRRFSH